MSVTIRDVAEKLGLSIATVSRALDGYPDIALKTRQRVRQVAQEMGYTPNRAARQLRRKKADAIGYILPASIPRFADPFYAEFLIGLSDATALHPYDLLISIVPPGDQAEQLIYSNWVQSHKVDGFLMDQMRHNDWRSGYLRQHKIPFVTLEHGMEKPDYPYVEIDNRTGMATLVSHLAQIGYRRLAFLGGPLELEIHSMRLKGFCEGLEQAGLPFYSAGVLPGDLTSDGGYLAVKHIKWAYHPPDAIVCVNDETAFGVLRALHELKLKVGADIAVTGFDGVQAARYTDPPLTTLDIPIYQIAYQMVDLLVAEIKGQPLSERHIVVQPSLIIRESTQKSEPARQ